MQLFVNPAGELSIYRQIMRQITEAIAGGRLQPGDKLPSHRDLAEQLVIAPLTVKKAYDELEAGGYIETQRGRGTFVSGTVPQPAPGNTGLRDAARNLLSLALLSGGGMPEAIHALNEVQKEMLEARGERGQQEKKS